MNPSRWCRSGALVAVVALACLVRSAAAQDNRAALAALERSWLATRTLHDQLDITRSLGAAVSPRGLPVDSLAGLARAARARADSLAARIRPAGLSSEDRDAYEAIRAALGALPQEAETQPSPDSASPACETTPALLPDTSGGLEGLTARVFSCYGAVTQGLVVDGDTLDRLTILGLLGRTDDPARRRRLFFGLAPVWRAVNGDDGAASPYRAMVRLRRASWGAGPTPMAERGRQLGLHPDTLEHWLVRVLEAWRATLPDTLLDPWDFHYYAGEASRRLAARVPRDSLLAINHRFYRSLGADPEALGIRYDLAPRPGKYPIAFTTFGARDPVEPWVFASYRIGGLDNLSELLHETGHGIHIAAIRARPALVDWPDSDTFTEAVAELAALEVNEPVWQQAFLGDSVPLAASLRGRYGGIVLDIAWSLLEIRGHRSPERSPNDVWTEITRDYLRIRPHPELSWWAVRGQLVNSPGYMLNYAFGAILVADLRARIRAARGPFVAGDSGWYAWVAPRLFAPGLARPARLVVEEFQGRPVSPAALLRDLARAEPRP